MGRALGSQYTLGDSLGNGAMGQVFRGTDRQGRPFAFKLLRSDLVEDVDFISRFHQERSILVSVRGPNVVAVHDLVVEGNTAAIVMDLVEGGTLRKVLADTGPILPAEVARIGARIAAALHDVHRAGIVHRDVKPENVLMEAATGTPKLTDFGVSKIADGSRVGRSTLLAGTPHYVAPEIADGQQATPAADLYSLGIVLYELCCAVTPFAGNSVLKVLADHGNRLPGRPAGVPNELWDVIWSLCQKAPTARPRSAEHVAVVLDDLAGRFAQRAIPVAPRLTAPPPSIPLGGNENETIMRPNVVTRDVLAERRKRRLVPIMVAIAVLLAGGVGAFVLSRGGTTTAVAEPAGGARVDGRPTAEPSTTTRLTTTTTARVTSISTMPDLVGLKLGEAREKLPEAMDVEIVEQVDQSTADGTVLSTEPAAGAAVDGKVKLVVARPAVTVYMDELKPSAGGWSSSGDALSVGMAGKQYLHGLGSYVDTSSCTRESRFVEYNLSKGFRRMNATAGIADSSRSTDLKIQLEVFADGRQITRQAIDFGKVVDLDLDLTNVLRLKIQWIVTSSQDTCYGNLFALGEAKLLGLASEVPVSGLPQTPTTTSTSTR